MRNHKAAKSYLLFLVFIVTVVIHPLYGRDKLPGREYNGWYSGAHLNRVAFPIGGIGAGMFCLEGTGALSHVSLRHQMEAFNEPCTFAALCVKGKNGNVAKVLEGQVPGWKIFGQPKTGNGAAGTSYGFPRFLDCRFITQFPFATIKLADSDIPLEVEITGWSPFVPGNSDQSSLPFGAIEYTFNNPTQETIEAVFSYNTKNFMAVGDGNTILPFDNGFILWQEGSQSQPEREGACAFFVDDDNVVVDHCWFKGGWWDSLTITWENIETARLMDNPPVKGSCPGASLFVPFKVKPGQTRTIRLMTAWHVPQTKLRYGKDRAETTGPAFGKNPSQGTATGQQEVSGFLGKGLINTFDPSGDGLTGTLTSGEFEITKNYIHFLIGGGNNPGKTCVNLIIDGDVIQTATGKNVEKLEWTTWDVTSFEGKKAIIQIVDEVTDTWGHINVDHIIMSDIATGTPSELKNAIVLNDFESPGYSGWVAQGPPAPCCPGEDCENIPTYHIPYYAGKFSSITEAANYWRNHYNSLREKSVLFRKAFYDTTLPPEVVEAVAANLTILKSPTVLRQKNGRLWCWEGCCDSHGCCAGSCTHVWNYAQAICHLFPDLERSFRHTEFNESQAEDGHQTFRSALPIRPIARNYHAASDGQLGGIMKVYRDWRISGDTIWLRKLWPQVKQSLAYCIEAWDPRHKGILEEPHHNTYDIEYWGPEGHCTSFYLGALAAAAEMGKALDEDVVLYQELVQKGRKFLETELFNGEYFYQKIQTEGLNAQFHPLAASHNGTGYTDIVTALNKQGPKYQYGTGCLSDGILGFWIARMSGLGQIIDEQKIKSNLNAIYKYNFKPDLSDHANPQRPSYAYGTEGGLLLCTWPKGGQLSIPFVYSNEVWTGIEYQVASHLMIEGMVDKGLDIVRACRDRYDGRIRNPFNEYECGHWYARAMASYGLIQGLTGARYDAVDKILYIDSRIGSNFKSFLATADGFGSVGLENGKPFIEVQYGRIKVEKAIVSGKETSLTRK
ncbi:MAG: hypothetical protein JXD22_15875 [Sedimentisphaerales bacterium]|nr:hypothetical protein [Sedimentisphaerales bacterium]